MRTYLLLLSFVLVQSTSAQERIVSYIVPNTNDIQFFWKDKTGTIINSIAALQTQLKANKQKLLVAMNGGMFDGDFRPVGLYIENGRLLKSLNKAGGGGTFGWKPNGVFYITKTNQAKICETEAFTDAGNVKFATQSGPMLISNGELHTGFKAGSTNINIRNGVGILPSGKTILAISTQPVSFYDFAMFFKNLGCKEAL